MLLKDHFITPRIVGEYREIDFKEAFTAIANRFIDPEVRGFMYKLAHGFGLSVPCRIFRIILSVVENMRKPFLTCL